jgi:RNA polymerase-interacting CarD/CdnL/TRCF family regulator
MASGSAFDLAETVNSLAIFSDTHKLSVGDSGMLLQARALLIDEISNVMGTTRGTAEEQIDRSLDERRQP